MRLRLIYFIAGIILGSIIIPLSANDIEIVTVTQNSTTVKKVYDNGIDVTDRRDIYTEIINLTIRVRNLEKMAGIK